VDDIREFEGFDRDGLRFLAELAKHNDRDWYERNKSRYVEGLVRPAEALVTAFGRRLEELFEGEWNYHPKKSLSRLHRDVRFSKDKSPYKTHLGIVWWSGEGQKMESPGFYLQLEAAGGTLYGGTHTFPQQRLGDYREAVAGDRGGALAKIVDALTARGYRLAEPKWKRVPSGYPADHPRERLLRHDGVYVMSPVIGPEAVTGAGLVDALTAHARELAALHRWLARL